MTKIEVKTPYLVLQKILSLANSSKTVLIEDSLYIADAMHLASSFIIAIMNRPSHCMDLEHIMTQKGICLCTSSKSYRGFLQYK